MTAPHTYLIAEAGVNHNGSLAMALQMVDAAADAGADAVKFQTFNARKLVTTTAHKAEYQKRSVQNETQYEMLRKLELTRDDHLTLIHHAAHRNIDFLSSPFDNDSADMLAELGVKSLKIGSGEITNLFFLRHLSTLDLPVILSTGMSTLEEVGQALRALGNTPTTLLHCVTSYPAPVETSNLRAMQTMREAFGLPVGWSDHTTGISISLAAVALGACVVEKHFTMDRALPGPDHAASLEPGELGEMIRMIRDVERALGSGEKRPAQCELEIRNVARRSIVAARDIAAGERLKLDMLDFRRPGTGIAPGEADSLVNRTVRMAIPEGTLLSLDMLS